MRKKQKNNNDNTKEMNSIDFGYLPKVIDVEQWLVENAKFEKIFQGRSIEKRLIHSFVKTFKFPATFFTNTSTDDYLKFVDVDTHDDNIDGINREKSVLFISLVHGNEIYGLTALLQTVESLLKSTVLVSSANSKIETTDIKIILVPFVNIDAYEANRRASKAGYKDTQRCNANGIDLNRNFGTDWMYIRSTLDTRRARLYGTRPFSEIESTILRDIFLQYRPNASLSFHTRVTSSQPLIIYPYSSDKPSVLMKSDKIRLFKEWAEIMAQSNIREYITGTAIETVNYYGSGIIMDWAFAEVNTMAFVHESGTPCGNRWCDPLDKEIYEMARDYSQVGLALVRLVHNMTSNITPRATNINHEITIGNHFDGTIWLSLLFLFVMLGSISFRYCRRSSRRYVHIINSRKGDGLDAV